MRYLLAWDHALCRAVVGVFMRAVLGFLRRRARDELSLYYFVGTPCFPLLDMLAKDVGYQREIFASLQERRRFERPYLKMDTQGFDLEVVRGATETLRVVPVLQTEVSVRPLYAGMPDYITSIRTLEERGFELSGLFPVVYDTSFRVVEFDCVMANRCLRRD